MTQGNESTAIEPVVENLVENANSKSVISVAGAVLAVLGGSLLINKWRRNRD